MTRLSIVKILYKHLVDITPEEIFHKADSIHTALVHLVSITHNIINHVNMMPPKHAQYLMQTFGVPPELHSSITHYLSVIKANPVYRRQTRGLVIINTLNMTIVMIYNNLCNVPPKKARIFPVAGEILHIATANILAMDVYGSYTYYYTITSTVIMLLKHLFVTFCHFLELLRSLPDPAFEELLSAFNISPNTIEKLRTMWLIDQIFRSSEDARDVRTEMVSFV